jgi:acetyl esterase/lipase
VFAAGLILSLAIFACAAAQAPQGEPAKPSGETIAENVLIERNVDYGRAGGISLKLDVLKPAAPAKSPRPAILFIHGGTWCAGDKAEGLPELKPLVQSGDFVGFTINYRFTGDASWPAQLHDCKAAIRWVRANADKYGVNPDRIAVWGVSAGGHLVNMLGLTCDRKEFDGASGTPGVSSRVQCVVNNCGPTDLPNINFVDTMDQALLAAFLGGPLAEKGDVAKAASPLHQVPARRSTDLEKGTGAFSPEGPAGAAQQMPLSPFPAFLHLYGTKDPVVKYDSQAVAFHEALKKAGVDSTLIAVRDGGHPAVSPSLPDRVRAFFDKHLRDKPIEVSAEPVTP